MCVNLVSSHIQGELRKREVWLSARGGGRLELRCARVCSWEQERLSMSFIGRGSGNQQMGVRGGRGEEAVKHHATLAKGDARVPSEAEARGTRTRLPGSYSGWWGCKHAVPAPLPIRQHAAPSAQSQEQEQIFYNFLFSF